MSLLSDKNKFLHEIDNQGIIALFQGISVETDLTIENTWSRFLCRLLGITVEVVVVSGQQEQLYILHTRSIEDFLNRNLGVAPRTYTDMVHDLGNYIDENKNNALLQPFFDKTIQIRNWWKPEKISRSISIQVDLTEENSVKSEILHLLHEWQV